MPSRETTTLAWFYVLVFITTLPFYALNLLSGFELLPKLPASALSVACPALVALGLTARRSGLAAARALAARSFDVRRIDAPLKAALAILVSPVCMWLSYACTTRYADGFAVTPLKAAEAAKLGLMFYIGAVCEELGWSGFAAAHKRGTGIARKGLEIGVVWAAWHIVPLLSVGRTLTWIGWWAIMTVAQRVVLVWVYEVAAGSVTAVAMSHALRNFVWMLIPSYGTRYDPKLDAAFSVVVALSLVAARRGGREPRSDAGPSGRA